MWRIKGTEQLQTRPRGEEAIPLEAHKGGKMAVPGSCKGLQHAHVPKVISTVFKGRYFSGFHIF